MAGVNFSEEHFEVLHNEFLIEEGMGVKIAFNPSIKFFFLKNVVSVFVMFQEDILDKLPAEIIHNYYITSFYYIFFRESSFLWKMNLFN